MIIGTAGHIDHGKTRLVQALTGVDTDRLAEEKRRGITIDLGFAYTPLANGQVLGFVDVPGHERFVRTMVAGATGIDFVLLVVAADDGIMPQTLEHLQIVDLLDIRHGLVVLNKIDLVDRDRQAEVEDEVRAALVGTSLARADIVSISAADGSGIDALRSRLLAQAEQWPQRSRGGAFRLAIDRSFTLPGAGTVITGMVLSGSIKTGDEVIVLPQRLSARVRSIHAQNRKAERGAAGERCALNLTGKDVTKEHLGRGDWIVAPSHPLVTDRVDVHLRLLATERNKIRDWAAVHFHVGASAVPAHVIVLSGDALSPGSAGLCQVVLDRPLALRHHDRFVLRQGSARRTIGGGRVLDLRAPQRRRRTPERLATLEALQSESPGEALQALLALPPGLINLSTFSMDRMLTEDFVEALVHELKLLTLPIGTDRYAIDRATWNGFKTGIQTALENFHRRQPDLPGMPAEKLRTSLAQKMPKDQFQGLLSALSRLKAVALVPPWVRLATHSASLAAGDARLWNRMQLLIAKDRFRPPRVHDLAAAFGLTEANARRLCKSLARRGELIEVSPDRFYLRESVAEMAAIARDLSQGDSWEFTAASFRDRVSIGRNATIQILEFFDRDGLTRRRGDTRQVIKDPVQMYGSRPASDPIEHGGESFPVERPDFKSGRGR